MSGFADSINRSQQHIDSIANSLSSYFEKKRKNDEDQAFYDQFNTTKKGQPMAPEATPILPRSTVPVASLKPEVQPAIPEAVPQRQEIPVNKTVVGVEGQAPIVSVPTASFMPENPVLAPTPETVASAQNVDAQNIAKKLSITPSPSVATVPVEDRAVQAQQALLPQYGKQLSTEETLKAMAQADPSLLKNSAWVNAVQQAQELKQLTPDLMQQADLQYKLAQTEALKKKPLTSAEQYEARAIVKDGEGDIPGAIADRATAKAMRESLVTTASGKEQAKNKAIPAMYSSWAKSKFETMSPEERQKYDNNSDALAIDLMQGNDLQKIKARAEAQQMNGGSFVDLPEEDKAFWFDRFSADGTLPPLASRDVKGRDAFIKSLPRYMADQGISGGDAVVNKMVTKAYSASLQQQQKFFGAMGGFVRNLDQQINKVEEISKDLIKRVGIRIIDLPLREWKTVFVGSGQEKVLESYLTEISNEIAKLSTGSQGSVAELSVGAQERWNKIHDPNLSFGELKKVLDATREQAEMRQRSAKEEINSTTKAISDRVNKRSGASGKKEKYSIGQYIKDNSLDTSLPENSNENLKAHLKDWAEKNNLELVD